MKVNIGPYTNWIGPYQIAEKILFWKDKYKDGDDEFIHKFGTWLAEDKNGDDSWLTKVCQWVDSKKKRKVDIHIDKYDVWNLDSTLAIVLLPLLKEYKEQINGCPATDPEDAPEHLREPEDNSDDFNKDFHHARWAWIVDEVIWTFTQLHPDTDWESQYYSGNHDIKFEELDNGMMEMVKGPKDTFSVNRDGLAQHEKRIANGLRLFGKYVRNMWT